jgi:hypothetical protein
VNRTQHGREDAEIAVVHAGITIYRVIGNDRSASWSYTTCAECALRGDGAFAPHAFDVRRLPNPERLDLEDADEAARDSVICEILRRSTDAGTIAASRCERCWYGLEFSVPFDTPGSYIRSMFALYGLPRSVADAFFTDVSNAVRQGRHDLLLSERRLVANALATALAPLGGDTELSDVLEAEICGLLVSEGSPATTFLV